LPVGFQFESCQSHVEDVCQLIREAYPDGARSRELTAALAALDAWRDAGEADEPGLLAALSELENALDPTGDSVTRLCMDEVSLIASRLDGDAPIASVIEPRFHTEIRLNLLFVRWSLRGWPVPQAWREARKRRLAQAKADHEAFVRELEVTP